MNSANRKLPTVLLVDDDPDSLMLLSFILESFSCTVVCESSGEAVLERLRHDHFDLVMLDIQLPGLSGLEIVRILRANPINCGSACRGGNCPGQGAKIEQKFCGRDAMAISANLT